MAKFNISSTCLNQTPLDWNGNKCNILNALEKARADNSQLVLFPELCISGYGCGSAFLSSDVLNNSLNVLGEIVDKTEGINAVLGLPVLVAGKVYNAAAVISNASLLGFVAKQFLSLSSPHYEPRYFAKWQKGETLSIDFRGRQVPFGDVLFDFPGLRVGVEISTDVWAKERPALSLISQGANLLVNLSASSFAFGKIERRKSKILSGIKNTSCGYVFSNLLGNEAGQVIYDGGAIFAWDGQLKFISDRLSYLDFQVTTLEMELGEVDKSVKEPMSTIVKSNYLPPFVKNSKQVVCASVWEDSQYLKEEEFSRAVSLGLYDYLRKSKAQGFVISLSGGVDSTSLACLCYLMVEFGLQSIGLKSFLQSLDHLSNLANVKTKEEIVRRLITCAYQGTRNSSDIALNASKEVASALGVEFYELDIDSLVEGYTELLSKAVEKELTWNSDDLVLQNIQARVRAPSIWMLANVKRALLLATSNRSEVAVGYCTMDGDTCGGLSPIAQVNKTFLRNWLRWLEVKGPLGVRPISQLSLVNSQEPTAELRPKSSVQTDEADLMPYEVLDYIDSLLTKSMMSPIEIFKELKGKYCNKQNKLIGHWVERFFTLWASNRWKQERYAPSFYLDDELSDPKCLNSFPILSGGYRQELHALNNYIEFIDKEERNERRRECRSK